MKRYEKMSKEEIIHFFMGECCYGCKAKTFCDNHKSASCPSIKEEWLNEEIETKPRWATIKSNEDLVKLYDEWKNGKIYTVFVDWLNEEVEV